jgi:hypothetical protein
MKNRFDAAGELTPEAYANMYHAGLRLEGRPLRYVRAALYQASAAE